MSNKKVIFTINLGGYDTLTPIAPEPGFDCICFTDGDEKVKGWKMVKITTDQQLYESRRIKHCPHLYLKGYDVYVYIDANIKILSSLSGYVERYFQEGYLAQVHSTRQCVYEEARKVIELGKDNRETVVNQIRDYIRKKFPKNYGLFANAFIIRDNSFNDFCESFYKEIECNSYRDQLSLPFMLWKLKPKGFNAIQSFYSKRYLTIKPHKRAVVLPSTKERPKVIPKVWYFTPGRGDKNLGRAYNDHCELVPDGDWICIMDGDVLFLNPFWSRQIEDIIIRYGNKYPLISCLTNRLGLEWQLPYGFSEDPNILNHAKIADKHFDLYYDEVIPSIRQTAGLFMLFPKSSWKNCKFEEGLTNGGQFVDFTFATKIMENLGTIGIAKGIYLFHFYRFNRKHKRDIDHLL